MIKTRSYQPSNGTEGYWFTDKFCSQCEKDRKYHNSLEPDPEDGCKIIVYAFGFSKRDNEYPKEWISDDDGCNPRCTAFMEYQEPDKGIIDPVDRGKRYREMAEAKGQLRLI